jgi:hypothetical protein
VLHETAVVVALLAGGIRASRVIDDGSANSAVEDDRLRRLLVVVAGVDADDRLDEQAEQTIRMAKLRVDF